MKPRTLNVTLWVVQMLLAVLFLFAGGVKAAGPAAMLTGPPDLPIWFVRFIGRCEVLGALGLVLPGVLRVRERLTPLAASGLVVIMIGATVVNFIWVGAGTAAMTVGLGLLAAFVAYARFEPAAARGGRLTT